jgi:hypothetical protein
VDQPGRFQALQFLFGSVVAAAFGYGLLSPGRVDEGVSFYEQMVKGLTCTRG